MRLCEDVVTVFVSSVDPATRSAVYAPTVIEGAGWYETQAEAVDPKGGLTAAHKVIVRIPAEVMPEGLAVKGGDVIVKGAAEGEGWTPAKLKGAFPGFMTVLAVTDNRRAPRGKHVKVVGT